MKVTMVNRKHAGCLTNPELAGLSVRHSLDLYNDTWLRPMIADWTLRGMEISEEAGNMYNNIMELEKSKY